MIVSNCFMLSFLVDKAAAGANVNILVKIERAEGEVTAALARFATLLIWISCLSEHVMFLNAVSLFPASVI